jgi:hypothetical protein
MEVPLNWPQQPLPSDVLWPAVQLGRAQEHACPANIVKRAKRNNHLQPDSILPADMSNRMLVAPALAPALYCKGLGAACAGSLKLGPAAMNSRAAQRGARRRRRGLPAARARC